MSVRRNPRAQRGDISLGAAVAVTLVLIALLAWWMYWPETIPVFGHRPESELNRRPDAPGAKAGARGGDRAAQGKSEANPPLYKWRDDSGQWHVTDHAPKDREFEKVVVDPGTNVLPPPIPELPPDKEQKPH